MSELLEALRTAQPLPAAPPGAPARPVPMAEWIIQANTQRHTVNGYTSFPALAEAHAVSIRELARQLQTLNGANASPASGCHISEQRLGTISVQVEFEGEPASGDGWNEPRHEIEIVVTRVFLHGTWQDAQDVVPQAVIDRWEAAICAGGACQVSAPRTGRPAFPTPDLYNRNGDVEYGSTGMTLRDYFAAKAMQEVLSWEGFEPKETATLAYEMADAMLRERAK